MRRIVNVIAYLSALVIIGSFLYLIIHGQRNNKLISQYGIYSTGTITKKYRPWKGGYMVNYEYYVKGNKYAGYENDLPIGLDKIYPGAKFPIRYDSLDPSISNMYFVEPNDSSKVKSPEF